MSGIFKLIMAVVVSIAIVACATVVQNPTPLSEVRTSPQSSPKEYRIQAGDQLDVKFFYNPELNEQVTVRPDGRISLQLAPEITAAGATPAELTETLRKQYAKLIDTPEVVVIVRIFSNQRVYVDGEVVKPGIVALTNDMTLMQAVSQAGGFKDTARTHEVIVMRRSTDGKAVSMVVNVDSVIDGSETQQDIALLSYDVVYVPKRAVSNLNVWVDQYIRKNIPLPIGVGYTINNGN